MKRKKEDTPALHVLQEKINIDKKSIVSGKVIIRKKVSEEEEVVAVPITHEEVEIKKIAINNYVEEAPQIRYEGDTTIIPVIKEVLVVEKKLLLVEEVHVTKRIVQKTKEHTIPLRKEEIEVERYTRNSNNL